MNKSDRPSKIDNAEYLFYLSRMSRLSEESCQVLENAGKEIEYLRNKVGRFEGHLRTIAEDGAYEPISFAKIVLKNEGTEVGLYDQPEENTDEQEG